MALLPLLALTDEVLQIRVTQTCLKIRDEGARSLISD